MFYNFFNVFNVFIFLIFYVFIVKSYILLSKYDGGRIIKALTEPIRASIRAHPAAFSELIPASTPSKKQHLRLQRRKDRVFFISFHG